MISKLRLFQFGEKDEALIESAQIVNCETYLPLDHVLYDEILATFFKGFDQIVVQKETHPWVSIAYNPSNYQILIDTLPQLPTSFITEFKQLNRNSVHINCSALHSIPVESISTEFLHQLLGPEYNWKRFFDKYQDSPGVIRFTRPWFSEVNQLAIVEFTQLIPNDNAVNTIVAFQRIDSRWQIIYNKELFLC